MNRIRYVKQKTGLLKSMRNYTTNNGVEVSVELDTNAMTYRIVDATTSNEVSSGGETVNLNILKTKAKSALQSLGVVFKEESRKERQPKLTLVDSGFTETVS